MATVFASGMLTEYPDPPPAASPSMSAPFWRQPTPSQVNILTDPSQLTVSDKKKKVCEMATVFKSGMLTEYPAQS